MRIIGIVGVLVVALASGATAQGTGAPTNIGVLIHATAVKVTWDAPRSGTPDSYVLEVGSVRGSTDLLIQDLGSATTFQAIAPPGTYYVRLRSRFGGTLSNPSATEVIAVPSTCNRAPSSEILSYTVSGPVVTFFWLQQNSAVNLPHAYSIDAGTGLGSGNLAHLVIPATGQGSSRFSVAAPPGAYWVRITGANPCGGGTPSTESLVLVGQPTTSATGRWTGSVTLPCPNDPNCPAGVMGWRLELDILQTGLSIVGTYWLQALDNAFAPESFGIAAGTIAPSGAIQLALTARPIGGRGSNPGGTFSGSLAPDAQQIGGTVTRIPVAWLPNQNPTLTLSRR